MPKRYEHYTRKTKLRVLEVAQRDGVWEVTTKLATTPRNGLVYYETRFVLSRYANTNAFTRPLLCHFRYSSELTLADVTMALDNALCHCRPKIVFEEEAFLDAQLPRLGPYSSMLYTIENVLCTLKSSVKAFMRESR
ncbi:hypothetical protein GN244_ATG03204 [Phytophthora infestans]|uniref:Tc1-like transposase DDE domain-containing protein n=1 Tax=Phytophthora infestans TaxID=4787 RepID=A0A833WNX0_PHYIN|nr:hypothetical protein GN244_ATG03204 [Phytophthora infestans]KAF4142873.1 hypothetical protein GN958_ATG07936 [Phytophthora infestans]